MKAISGNISTSGAWLEIKWEFNKFLEKLKNSYGKTLVIDNFLEGGIYNEYTDWMDSIIHLKRSFFASWDGEDWLSLPNELKTIFLGVGAKD